MDYEELLKKRIIEPVEVSQEEIKDLLKISERDIKAAQSMIYMDLDWAFTIAYNAILQTSLAYMNSLGFRPRGEGKHVNTFRFLQSALPKEYSPISGDFKNCARKETRLFTAQPELSLKKKLRIPSSLLPNSMKK